MILTTVAVAGALGTGTLGIKAYREEKKKKEYPWTYALMRMNKKEKKKRGRQPNRPLVLPSRTKKKSPLLLDGVSRRLSESMLSTKTTLTRVKKQLVKPFAQAWKRSGVRVTNNWTLSPQRMRRWASVRKSNKSIAIWRAGRWR